MRLKSVEVARRLGVSEGYVSQIKKKYKIDYWDEEKLKQFLRHKDDKTAYKMRRDEELRRFHDESLKAIKSLNETMKQINHTLILIAGLSGVKNVKGLID